MANTLKFGNGQWATGNGTALAYNDENSNFKPLPFDFTRASSGTVVNQSGLIETVGSGIPRIDFLGNTKGAMLLEPSRTNLIENSYLFNSFAFGRSTKTLESGINPDGTTDVVLMSATSGTDGTHRAYSDSISVVNGTTYTISLFVKKGTSSKIQFDLLSGGEGGIGFGGSIFDFNNETITKGFFEVFNDDWYHLKSTGTVNTTTSTSRMFLYVYDENGNKSFSANGTENMNLFGAQVEQGSYATSYIPTSGSAVTRVADSCINGGNEQVINSTEGVLYWEGSLNSLATGVNNEVSISDGSVQNYITLYYEGGSTSKLTISSVVASVNVVLLSKVLDQTVNHKAAISWSLNNYSLWIDGIKEGEDLSASVPTAGTFITTQIDGPLLNRPFYGNVKDIRVYNTALTDNELAALTQV